MAAGGECRLAPGQLWTLLKVEIPKRIGGGAKSGDWQPLESELSGRSSPFLVYWQHLSPTDVLQGADLVDASSRPNMEDTKKGLRGITYFKTRKREKNDRSITLQMQPKPGT